MKRTRRFTGYHAAAIFGAFFAVVIAVNAVMATLAVSTFGGTVVDNSYVASQKYNGWLAEARRERELGWTAGPPVREGGAMTMTAADALDQPLTGARVAMHAIHPLGREPARDLTFTETAPGTYSSVEQLPAGRWKLRVRIARDGREANLIFEVQ